MYNQKKMSVDQILAQVKSGDAIEVSLCAMEPFTLMGNLHKIAANGIKNVTVTSGLELGSYAFNTDEKYADVFDNAYQFLFPGTRKGFNKGVVDYLPSDLHNCGVKRYLYKPPTIAFFAATPMDSHGYVRCSLSQMHECELLEICGGRIYAEINPNFPVVGGDTAIHISQLAGLVEVNTPVPQMPRSEPEEIDKTIGGYVAELINDGATLQLGIGGIPDAAARALENKKELGVHTEMLTNSIATLVEKGVITGTRKTLKKGKMVATFAFGDQKLYDMMHNNPAVEILRASYVNDPAVILQNDNMVSVNSCIALDLSGQICSESIGHIQYSGTGGASDFAFGASHAKNGKAIIALHSTARNGEISTIVPSLPLGSIVSIRRNNVDYVVTEYGIAPLFGRTVRERVNNLIAVAHPNFRAELKAQAEKLGLH
jgi:acyl-CoA hydrolase